MERREGQTFGDGFQAIFLAIATWIAHAAWSELGEPWELELDMEHDWAGVYSLGDSCDYNLRLAIGPTSGFTFRRHGCTGIHDRDFGGVSFDDDRIQLHPTFSGETDLLHRIGTEFLLVRWGERRYLISERRIPIFVDAIHAGDEPRWDAPSGSFFLRETGEFEPPVSGAPILPERFSDLLTNPSP